MKLQAIHHLIPVHDMNRAVAFYCRALGFAKDIVTPDLCELHREEIILILQKREAGPSFHGPVSIPCLDIHTTYARAIARGGVSLQTPRHRTRGDALAGTFTDPEGNVIELTHLPV